MFYFLPNIDYHIEYRNSVFLNNHRQAPMPKVLFFFIKIIGEK